MDGVARTEVNIVIPIVKFGVEVGCGHRVGEVDAGMEALALPTDAENEAFQKLEMVADTANSRMTFYSEDNTVALSIGVKGVF